MRFLHNPDIDGRKLRPPLTRQERKRVRLTKERKRRNIIAWQESKHHSITPAVVDEFVQLWDGSDSGINPEELAADLVSEHQIFANTRTAAELEDSAPQTVVGIGEYKKRGYVLVFNEAKGSLGFPGGRVRHGQRPEMRLVQEVAEEVNLVCEILGPPVSEHKVGEEEHLFTAFEVRYVGGKPVARPTEDEPIAAIIFIGEKVLLNACRINGCIRVKGLSEPVGVLTNHRKVFLDYMSKRQGGERKEAADV